MIDPVLDEPSKLCGACGTLTSTSKAFCPECGTPYGQKGGGRAPALVWGAFACSAVALFFFPIVLGPVAIVLAAVAMSRNEPHATVALVVAVGAMLVGFILGVLVA